MKSKEYVLKRMLQVLTELENDSLQREVKFMLRYQLSTYNEILDDEDVPEEYWDRIEELL